MGAGRRRALQGLVLSLGAPIGWLSLRLLGGRSLADEIARNLGLYLYLSIPTALVFGLFGAALGAQEQRLAAANRRLSDDALTDPLTGLKNLRYFRARLEEEYANSQRQSLPIALLMIDLDRFKSVNDRHGHPEGDRLLKAIGRAIASVVRLGETAARVGGEEFALLLPGATGDEALAAAERVRSAVATVRVHSAAGEIISITTSVGCASTSDLGEVSVSDLYETADKALYEAKRRGRDRAERALRVA